MTLPRLRMLVVSGLLVAAAAVPAVAASQDWRDYYWSERARDEIRQQMRDALREARASVREARRDAQREARDASRDALREAEQLRRDVYWSLHRERWHHHSHSHDHAFRRD